MAISIHLCGFSLADTLNCGQCFRASEEGCGYRIVAGSRSAFVQQQDDSLLLETPQTDTLFWRNYFDADTDYAAIIRGFAGDEVLEQAATACGGIRILRQDGWETLISFILSANNNIPRIKGIISRLCELLGEPSENGSGFPSPARLAGCTPEDLAPLRAGFRTRYILDAAQRVASGQLDLQEVQKADYKQAKQLLMQVCGVGVKVADCILLYGFHKMEAFPVDVWMKRALAQHYPNGLSKQALTCPGYAQQLLFHSQRTNKEKV